MPYLTEQLILHIAIAAVLGFIIGWGVFGLRKKPVVDTEAEKKQAALRKKAEAKVHELEAMNNGLVSNLSERDGKLAELKHQLDELAKFRIQDAEEATANQQRIAKLETSLRQRDAEMAALTTGDGGDVVINLQNQLKARDGTIKKLETRLEALDAASPDASLVQNLRAEISELRATLESSSDDAEQSAALARLREEITGLKAAYDAAERSLEEQDGAIDALTSALATAQQEIASLRAGKPVEPSAPEPVKRTPAAARPVTKPLQPSQAVSAPVAADDDDDDAADATKMVDPSELVAAIDAGRPEPKPAVAEGATTMVSQDELMASVSKAATEEKASDNTATPDEPDDLKQIRGIGPALEKRLLDAGIFSWAQLAQLSESDCADLAGKLSVSVDKIMKQGWIDQAKALSNAS